MSLSVSRVKYSSYQAKNFKDLEINALKDHGYVYTEKSPDVLITNSNTYIEDLKKFNLQKTKLIIHPNSGYDNFDIDFLKSFKGKVIAGSPIRAQAVSEYILTEVFNSNKIFSQSFWDREKRNYSRDLLSTKSVLVYGYGHIGKILEKSLMPLVRSIYFYDPFVLENERPEIRKFDFIIFACGLNSTNKHMVDFKYLEMCKKDVHLINAARGPLIVFEDLKKFLNEFESSKASLDVFENEPFEINKHAGLKNLKMTSHLAGYYNQLDDEIIKFVLKVLNDFENNNDFDETYKSLDLKNKIHNGELI